VAFLSDNSPELRWVLSLADLHCSAYGEHTTVATILYIQDAGANAFATLALSPAERSQWMHELQHAIQASDR